MSNVVTIGHNNADAKLKELIKRATKLGEAANKGEGSLPALGLDVVAAAANGEITVNIDAKAKTPDDVETIYNAYLAARVNQKAVTAPAQQVSKLRSIAKVGARLGDAGATLIENAKQMHDDAQGNEEAKKLMRKGSKYDFMVTVAAKQLEQIPKDAPFNCGIDPLTEEELNLILFPGEPEPKSDAERVRKLFDTAKKLNEGKKDKDGNVIQEPIENDNLSLAVDYLYSAWAELDPEAYEAEKAQEMQDAKAQAHAEQIIAALGTKKMRELLRNMH